MKRLSICLTMAAALAFSTGNVLAAFTLTANHTDKLVTDPDFGSYAVMGTGSTSVSGSVAFSGFDASVFNSSSDVTILLDNGGSGGIYFNLADASLTGTEIKPVIDYTSVIDTFLSTETTKVKLSFTTNTLTATISANYDAFDVGITPNGTISKVPTHLTIFIGEMAVDTTLYLSGSSTTVTRNMGDSGLFDLTTVKLSGTADTAAPTVAFITPANNFKTSNDAPLQITGSVKDTYAVSRVVYTVTQSSKLTGQETFSEAELTSTSTWKTSATLQPGTNYVFVKAEDGALNWSTVVSRAFYYAKLGAVSLQIDGSGTVKGVVDGQGLELGKGYTATAKPNPGAIFRGWKDESGNVLSTNLAQSFVMADGLKLRASFIPNPYVRAKGTYNGLFYGYDATGTNFVATNSGFLTLTLTTNGSYSGKITMIAGSYSISGQLGLTGDDTNAASIALSVKRSKLPNLEVSLTCDLTGSGALSGTLWQTLTNGTRLNAQFDGLLVSAQKPGVSTLYNLAATEFTDLTTGEPGPAMGAGYGSLTIDKNNGAKLTLYLPDANPAFSVTGNMSVSNSLPFFNPLYSKTGVFMGWISGDANTDYVFTNTVWTRPSAKTPKYYTNGFAVSVHAFAATYTPPKTGTNILSWTNGMLQWGGGLTEPGSLNPIKFDKNAFTYPSGNPNGIKMTLAPTTGIITGSYGNGKTAVSFKAVILPKFQTALGFATGTTNTGWIRLYTPE